MYSRDKLMRAVSLKIIIEQCQFEILRTGQTASVHVARKSVVEFQEDTGHSLVKVKEFKTELHICQFLEKICSRQRWRKTYFTD
jgi:hypothetical protein